MGIVSLISEIRAKKVWKASDELVANLWPVTVVSCVELRIAKYIFHDPKYICKNESETSHK